MNIPTLCFITHTRFSITIIRILIVALLLYLSPYFTHTSHTLDYHYTTQLSSASSSIPRFVITVIFLPFHVLPITLSICISIIQIIPTLIPKSYTLFTIISIFVVCFLLGNSPASECYIPTFRNTLSDPSS
jgi:hypothetical protein